MDTSLTEGPNILFLNFLSFNELQWVKLRDAYFFRFRGRHNLAKPQPQNRRVQTLLLRYRTAIIF